ncbi:pseudouridine synthase [Alkalicoccus chagannorensis]|uniref:pseudouridine synthase n=1 Tax=Alkalicoccus chagannorensis TaxID=427072 RepID=UPI00040036DE|nr:pseudouridine synthase [Alkalicoccus chagannorensis]
MRADKLLAKLGYGSRKEVKKLLKQGALQQDGRPVKEGKTHVDPDSSGLLLFGDTVTYRDYVYLLMNKPLEMISATEDETEETVTELLEEKDQLFAPFPVGRLDKDTTGLLLLTNDGKLAHQLTSPKRKVDKEYKVSLADAIDDRTEAQLEKGMTLEDGTEVQPAVVKRTERATEIFLTIQEGKYHQVKRMLAACGNRVTALTRVRMGPIHLDKALNPGEYRELTGEELQLLQEHKK